jgi:lipopolysaccharide/colanic/teichoic acid biosynthesis glycosyltransferase
MQIVQHLVYGTQAPAPPQDRESPTAQVNGWRGNTSIAKRVEYDLYYLRNWSLTFDLQIITLTFVRMFSGKNAY